MAYQRNRGGTQTAPQNGNGSGGKNPPVFKRRCYAPGGTLELAVFEKQVGDDKKPITTYFVSLKRSYPDPQNNGQYITTDVLNPQDLLIAADLLKIAWDFILDETNRE